MHIYLLRLINDIPVTHLSWKNIYELANLAKASSNNSTKKLIKRANEIFGRNNDYAGKRI